MALGQRIAKSDGRPSAKWSRRGDESHSRVLTWFASRWRNHQPKRAERPHSKSSRRNPLDGPAMRPVTPLAVENGVGKLAANFCWRQMSARERELGALPSPTFVPVRPQGRAGTFVSDAGRDAALQRPRPRPAGGIPALLRRARRRLDLPRLRPCGRGRRSAPSLPLPYRRLG